MAEGVLTSGERYCRISLDGLFAPAAFLVLQTAAAWARIVAACSGTGPGTRDPVQWRLLPVPQGGQFCNKGPTVGEEAFIAGTQVVPVAAGCREEAVLGASSVAHRPDLACPARAG